MLEARTKQINSKSEAPWAPYASKIRKPENLARPESSTSSASRSRRVQRRKPLISPIRKKRPNRIRGRDAEAEALDQKFEAARRNNAPTKSVRSSEVAKTLRTPLAARTLNLSSPPAIARKNKHAYLSKKLYKPSPDIITVDITVLDEYGKTVSMERRISRVRSEIKHNVTPGGHDAKPPNHTSTDRDDEQVMQPCRLQKAGSRIYSDNLKSDDLPLSTFALPLPKQTDNDDTLPDQPRPSSLHPVSRDEATDTQAHRSTAYSPSEPTTPIRGLRNSTSAIAPPLPTALDFDSSIELSDVEFESSPFQSASPYISVPDYLKPLLKECCQEDCRVHEFSSFIKSFPFDKIVRSTWINDDGGEYSFKKIGEASYSEVFGIGGVVLKIIPLRKESRVNDGKERQNNNIEEPATSKAKDVRKEIIVTRAMGEVCDGFVKLLKAYVVRGRYPELLLRLWDEYNEAKGSESVRPCSFTASQVYAIIVLPNGGSDLEAYTFARPRKIGWQQACSVFWQVTKALALAEQLVSFEHRDLHWGQILVKDLPTSAAQQNLGFLNPRTPQNLFMDDVMHGVQATIIDLGLSHMDAIDIDGCEEVYWTAIDEEIFMGEGDYQFDVYRMMREHVGSDWEKFSPFTNVMWLHYLVRKLLWSKDLKPPGSRAVQEMATVFSENECYRSLLEMEQLLSECVSAGARKKGKGKGQGKFQAPTSVGFSCAGTVVQYGVLKGWVMPTA
ncbi:hypothetical protein AX14_001082 [Amanita brunnescens Koide BX004]|nr:hypothetical protein AX14_001082 [Amanita brunnescens Koide BX004]